jgi:hypothetical protein
VSGDTVLIAWAFLCAVTASDCEREALARAIVGQGSTPIGCLMDGNAGAANNAALTPDAEHRLVIACRRKHNAG